jgi:hypothetical protein
VRLLVLVDIVSQFTLHGKNNTKGTQTNFRSFVRSFVRTLRSGIQGQAVTAEDVVSVVAEIKMGRSFNCISRTLEITGFWQIRAFFPKKAKTSKSPVSTT